MSLFYLPLIARNPKREKLETEPVSALVDTGSELSWLSGELLKGIGVTPRRRKTLQTASGEKLVREIGYAILEAGGFETNDEVVFAEKGDMTLIGVRTIEGFGAMVDNVAHKLVATTTIVASSASPIAI